jgi:hypothetical protein
MVEHFKKFIFSINLDLLPWVQDNLQQSKLEEIQKKSTF